MVDLQTGEENIGRSVPPNYKQTWIVPKGLERGHELYNTLILLELKKFDPIIFVTLTLFVKRSNM